MPRKISLLIALAAAMLQAADNYTGPVPPKPDVPYLLHASTLVATEVAEAKQETRKNESAFVVPGASSSARTPLAEPIFILDARELSPERIELYRLDVKNGNREVSVAAGKRKGGTRPIHLTVTPLANHLYRLEAGESLENGQYALSPSGNNRAFCFEVY